MDDEQTELYTLGAAMADLIEATARALEKEPWRAPLLDPVLMRAALRQLPPTRLIGYTLVT